MAEKGTDKQYIRDSLEPGDLDNTELDRLLNEETAIGMKMGREHSTESDQYWLYKTLEGMVGTALDYKDWIIQHYK